MQRVLQTLHIYIGHLSQVYTEMLHTQKTNMQMSKAVQTSTGMVVRAVPRYICNTCK